ncbi:MAG: M15 family metallopeptidase [Lachnospiraceae bacterium]|nr:M15 family metallopeptidase [Lachnospiraceae bacterium]
MKKRICIGLLLGVLTFCASCLGRKDAREVPEETLAEPIVSEAAEISGEMEAKNLNYIWYEFKEAEFALKVPQNASKIQPEDRHTVFAVQNDSLSVEICQWDRVSDPDEEALAALVEETTGEDTEIVERGGRKLVKVNWPHGDVEYYMLLSGGDAYSIRITPYVMKDPKVYWKVKEIENSFRSKIEPENVPKGNEICSPECARMDYLILVNKKNPLPEGWEENLDLVCAVNSVGDHVWVERTVYKAYLELRKDLLENEEIELDLDSAYRSVAYQQEIKERFTEKYGAAYANRTVAQPGYSEHHTGLAIDLYFRKDGTEVYHNEDLVQYPEVWKKIHARLNDYGFILRYPGPDGKTMDYTYEPWHIRYVGVEAAKEFAGQKELTFDEWIESKR